MKGYYFHKIIWDIGVKRVFYNGQMTKSYFTKVIESNLPTYIAGFYVKANNLLEAERALEEKFNAKLMHWHLSQFEITPENENNIEWIN